MLLLLTASHSLKLFFQAHFPISSVSKRKHRYPQPRLDRRDLPESAREATHERVPFGQEHCMNVVQLDFYHARCYAHAPPNRDYRILVVVP